MKKIFTLSLVAVSAVSAFAFQAKDNNVRTFAEGRPMAQKMISVKDVKNLDEEATTKTAAEAKTESTPYTAFYQMHGVLPMGYAFGEQGFGYGYSTPYSVAPCFGATCKGVYGNTWTIGSADTDITEECADNTYTIEGQKVGGGYYMPKIWNGADYYYFGSDGSKASVGYGVVFCGEYTTEAEEMASFGNYNVYGPGKWYGGFSNTVAYGSRKYANAKGQVVTSNTLMLEYEVPAGQMLVLDHIEIPVIVSADENRVDYENMWENEEATLEVTIYEETGVEGEYNTYHGTVTKDDIVKIADDDQMTIVFTEEEDGFETTVAPVLRNNFQVYIQGFAQEGIHIGIMMIYDENSWKGDDGYYHSEYGSHSYFDEYVDGEETSAGALYADQRVEAIVNLVGGYYTLCDYSTGGDFNGWVDFGQQTYNDPELGDFCVANSVFDEDDQKAYNDFDLLTCATAEELTIDCEDPYLLAYEIDDQYYADYGIYALYFYTKPLAAGEAAHTITGTISSDVASMNFNIVLKDESGSSISNIAETSSKKAIYNLMGQEVKNATSGLYIVNGKKVMK